MMQRNFLSSKTLITSQLPRIGTYRTLAFSACRTLTKTPRSPTFLYPTIPTNPTIPTTTTTTNLSFSNICKMTTPAMTTPAPTPPQLLSLIESAKRSAAYRAVDLHFPKTPGTPTSPLLIGIGSGSTVVYVVERILQLAPQLLQTCIFIPTGFQSRQLILSGGLTLGDIDSHNDLLVAFDGADEVDPNLNCIKGGGACLFQEKLVAVKARKFIVVADFRKVSENLGTQFVQGIPVEVVPPAVSYVMNGLAGLGCVQATLRMGGAAKAGPVVTDNGNFIIDAKFPQGVGGPEQVEGLARAMKSMVGVVEHGIFWEGDRKPAVAYFGMDDGAVLTREVNVLV